MYENSIRLKKVLKYKLKLKLRKFKVLLSSPNQVKDEPVTSTLNLIDSTLYPLMIYSLILSF